MSTFSDPLVRGQPIYLSSGASGMVGELIGSGGQGGVYAVDIGGRRMALKWYHGDVVRADLTLRSRIARMISHGPPDQNFLWPLEFAEIRQASSFGYIMPLMSGDRRPLKDIFVAPPRGVNPTLDVRANACFDIASSFQRLHSTGYCYQDINFGGFFIDAKRGTIQICDADNIAIDGEPGGVYGTRKFMAPEVVRREALPSTRTDLYSMAVLFFYLIFNWHPLDGKRETEASLMDEAMERKLYGQTPCFIFDPATDENGPVTKVHDWVIARWGAITERLRTLFTRVFTSGLDWRGDRPVESEWRIALAHLRASIVTCPACGFAHGVDQSLLRRGRTCVACGSPLSLPPLLAVGKDTLLLIPGFRIFDYQINLGYAISDDTAIGCVECHPRDPTMLGLKNASTSSWSARTPDGKVVTIAPGKTLRLIEGLVVNFGDREASISGVGVAADAPPRPAP